MAQLFFDKECIGEALAAGVTPAGLRLDHVLD